MFRNLFLLFLSCFVAVSCSKNAKDVSATEPLEQASDTMLRVGVLPTLDALPFFVAKEWGMFERENINVALVSFNSAVDIDTALVGNSIDVAFTELVRTEKLKANGKDTLRYLTATELGWSLVSNKVARINNLSQFGDKMVAMTRWSATDYLTNSVFDAVTTKAQVYSVQINDLDVRLKMLLNNELDAAWLPEPQATAAVCAGHKRLVTSGKYKEKFGVIAFQKRKKGKSVTFPEDKLRKVYSMACDSINKYGIKAYAREIVEYCHVNENVVKDIPKQVYVHAEQPLEKTVAIAKGFQRR